MRAMNITEKRDFIHSHLHQVKEPVLNDIYEKILALFKEAMLDESEEDIKNGNVISHQSLKQEVLNEKLTARAEKSENDILAGRVFTRAEVESRTSGTV